MRYTKGNNTLREDDYYIYNTYIYFHDRRSYMLANSSTYRSAKELDIVGVVNKNNNIQIVTELTAAPLEYLKQNGWEELSKE
jgi:hypothetical protein